MDTLAIVVAVAAAWAIFGLYSIADALRRVASAVSDLRLDLESSDGPLGALAESAADIRRAMAPTEGEIHREETLYGPRDAPDWPELPVRYLQRIHDSVDDIRRDIAELSMDLKEPAVQVLYAALERELALQPQRERPAELATGGVGGGIPSEE